MGLPSTGPSRPSLLSRPASLPERVVGFCSHTGPDIGGDSLGHHTPGRVGHPWEWALAVHVGGQVSRAGEESWDPCSEGSGPPGSLVDEVQPGGQGGGGPVADLWAGESSRSRGCVQRPGTGTPAWEAEQGPGVGAGSHPRSRWRGATGGLCRRWRDGTLLGHLDGGAERKSWEDTLVGLCLGAACLWEGGGAGGGAPGRGESRGGCGWPRPPWYV